ncbi:MAG: hypothetical protein IH984_15175 [Planctomycetes bacterium]|nr:hypothetical protein [Planctomycetota bacterium]
MLKKNRKRKRSMCAPFLEIGCVGVVALSASVASAQDRCFRMIDLGEIGEVAETSGPFGINNTGLAVFTKMVNGQRHAFVNVNSSSLNIIGAGNFDLHDLSGLEAGGESVAHDVNDSDIAVGWATFNGDKHAVVWRIDQYDPLETPPIPHVDLGLLDPLNSAYSEAFAINDDFPEPVIVGEGDVFEDCTCTGDPTNLIPRGFWRTLKDPPEDLTNAIRLIHTGASCYPTTIASDVNTGPGGAGHETTAVGYGIKDLAPCFEDSHPKGHYWNDPSTGQGVLLAGAGNDGWSARGMSDQGGIVGTVFFPYSAAYWPDINAAPVNIGSLIPGSHSSFAQRINNKDPAIEVIAAAGYRSATTILDEAVLWECAGECSDPLINNWSFTELNTEVILDCSEWHIRRAFDVNDEVSIICWARKFGPPSTEHAVILVPMELCCPADLDGNGTVGTSDLLILFANWGPCPAPPESCFADLNRDCTVNTEDQLILFANWGTCAVTAGGGGGGSSSLQAAVQQLGFPSLAAHQAWLAQAGEMEAYASTYVLLTILQNQE